MLIFSLLTRMPLSTFDQFALIQNGTFWLNNSFLNAWAPLFPILSVFFKISPNISPFDCMKGMNLLFSYVMLYPLNEILKKCFKNNAFRYMCLIFVLFYPEFNVYSVYPTQR